MTFEEKRVIKDRITAVVEEEIDRIANDRSVSSSAKKNGAGSTGVQCKVISSLRSS